MVNPWKESWHKRDVANFEVCNWFFKKSPFVCCENGTSKKNTVIIRLMSLFGSYILGIFFHVKIKIIDDFNDEFLICKWQVYKIFFLTSWTWTKNGVLNFKCTTFKLHKHFSNVSQFPFMNTSSNFIYNDKAITCLKKKNPSLLSLVSTSKKRTSHFRR